MSNSNYAQVSSLLAQGKLNWATDNISMARLVGGTFNAAHKLLSEVGGTLAGTALINGRALVENNALGQPVVFPESVADTEYQMVIVQMTGPTTSNLLAWIDENEAGDPITVERDGSLIVRPVEFDSTAAPDGTVLPPQVGAWMKL
jgi:hypothetical protein